MSKLEVIVMTAAEAVTAEKGGADRLELVRDLDTGGLTPQWETVQEVCRAASIPLRVMLRENASMRMTSGDELKNLCAIAAKFQELPIDGLVMGWTNGAGALDLTSLEAVLQAAPKCKVTFHRAFEHLADPFEGIRILKCFPQIDHILTGGGEGAWADRKQRLIELREAAGPEIGIRVGGGLAAAEVLDLMADSRFPEVHVGRAVRTPQENEGALDQHKIAHFKTRRGQ